MLLHAVRIRERMGTFWRRCLHLLLSSPPPPSGDVDFLLTPCSRFAIETAASDASSAAPPPFLGPIRGHRWPGFLCHAFGTWNGHHFFVLQSPQTCDGSIPAYSFMRFGCNACFAAWAQFLRSDFRVTVFCAARRSASVVRVSGRYRALAPGYDHFCDNIGWYITQ